MNPTQKYEANIYQSNSERKRNEKKVEKYINWMEGLQSDEYLSDVSLNSIPTYGRDANKDVKHPDHQLTDIVNSYQQWAKKYNQEVELLFLYRGSRTNENMGTTHQIIDLTTPIIEFREAGTLRGVFPSRIGDTIVDMETLDEILRTEKAWHNTDLNVRDIKSSGIQKHDAWVGNFIACSNRLIGKDWELLDGTEFQVTAPEFQGVRGQIDLVYYRETGDYYIIDIKPEATSDEFDRGIGQLYRYAELFCRQERLPGARPDNLNLALASPSIPDELQAIAERADIEPIEIFGKETK